MTCISTPFVLTLAAGDEVALTTRPRTGSRGGALGGNDFVARLDSIAFAEEHSTASCAAASRVRVSLLAMLAPHDSGSSDDGNNMSVTADAVDASKHAYGDDSCNGTCTHGAHAALASVTLASYVFDACGGCACAACTTADARRASGSGDDCRDAAWQTPSSAHVVLRSRLLLRANGPVSSLRVCAHDASAHAAPYTGPRRFAVRLAGQQVTTLSAHQVRVIADE